LHTMNDRDGGLKELAEVVCELSGIVKKLKELEGKEGIVGEYGGSAFRSVYRAEKELGSLGERLEEFVGYMDRKNVKEEDRKKGYFAVLPAPLASKLFSFLPLFHLYKLLLLNKYFHRELKGRVEKEGEGVEGLREFVGGLKLPPKYLSLLLSAGFTSLQLLALATEEDLVESGVLKPGHRRKLLYSLRTSGQKQEAKEEKESTSEEKGVVETGGTKKHRRTSSQRTTSDDLKKKTKKKRKRKRKKK